MKKKTCITCRATKPLNRHNFVFREDTQKYRNKCRVCFREERKDYMRKRRKFIPDKPECSNKLRRRKIKTRYGITLEEYDALLSTPCDICGQAAEVCDHCHDSGKVRGGLCRKCNSLLGFARDSADILSKAIKYLEDSCTVKNT